MMKNVSDYCTSNYCTPDWCISGEGEVINSIKKNNTYMPNVLRVIYNIGKKAYPKFDENGNRIKDANGKLVMDEPVDVLATVVFFDDKTKVSVVNSLYDGVKFEDHTLSNGTTVKVATETSKEIGLVYAMVKRLVARYDLNEPDKMVADGFGRRLRNCVKYAYDSTIEHAEHKIAKAKAKAEHASKLNTAKPKKRYSIAETLERINHLMDNLTDSADVKSGAYNKLCSIFKH